MSLLEDVFLQDEANEAEELERVIEGDEFEERRRSDSDENSEKEDEAEEDKRRVDPTKAKTTRVVKNPRFILNPARLTGPRGIQVIPDHFKDFRFKGKGHEKEDLDLVLKRLEHWAYRLYPKFQFEDCLKKIEMLGKKRPVAVHLHKIRSDQFLSEDTVVQKDTSDEVAPTPVQEDEFDKLLQQQIELARSTPAPNSAKKPGYGSVSPKDKRTASLMMPKATSSPSINDEQRERMLRSRKLAEERRLARLKTAANTPVNTNQTSVENSKNPTDINGENTELNMEVNESINKDTEEITKMKKHNRSNVIDSSDDENVETSVSVSVDVHSENKTTEDNIENEKSHSNIDVHNNLSDMNAIEIESEREIKENTDINSELTANGDNGLIANDKDNLNYDTDKSGSNVNSGNDHENRSSDEQEVLRYDDSDMNIDLNEPETTEKKNGSIINEEITEPKENDEKSKDTDIAQELVTKPSHCVELNNGENNGSNSEATDENALHKDDDKTENVPEELIEDVMDVDFTEDF